MDKQGSMRNQLTYGGIFIFNKRLLYFSLALVLWEIIEGKKVPDSSTPLNPPDLLTNDKLRSLLGDCLSLIPSSRPTASSLAQRFLDKYNDSCAKNAPPQESVD